MTNAEGPEALPDFRLFIPRLQASVAQQRQQQFRELPGGLPHEGASPSAGPMLP